jgi:hypothetical protein
VLILVLIAVIGLIVGVLQARILAQASPQSVWWIPTSIVAWSLGSSTLIVNELFLPLIPGIVGALLYVGVVLVGGVLFGVVSGLMLRRLLRPALAMA